MLIRQATFNDIPVIHQLAPRIWRNTYSKIISEEQIVFMLDKMYAEEVLKQQFEDGIQFLLAERDKEAVGFAGYALKEQENKIYSIQKLYILPSEQGRGTGKKLVHYIASLVKELGGEVLELNVNRSNPAVNFYKKLGFEIYESIDIPYYQFVLNDFVMRKKL